MIPPRPSAFSNYRISEEFLIKRRLTSFINRVRARRCETPLIVLLDQNLTGGSKTVAGFFSAGPGCCLVRGAARTPERLPAPLEAAGGGNGRHRPGYFSTIVVPWPSGSQGGKRPLLAVPSSSQSGDRSPAIRMVEFIGLRGRFRAAVVDSSQPAL